jgi:hypothetical protein
MATINLGAIKFNWKGAYNSSTSYAVDDVVSSGGNSYVCIQAHSNQAVGNATAYWNIMSSAGTNGTNGTDLTTTLTTQGDIVYRDGSGLQRLGYGTAGQVLQTGGSGANPSWVDASGGKTLQAVSTTFRTGENINNTNLGSTWREIGTTSMELAMTPQKGGSKILVNFQPHIFGHNNQGTSWDSVRGRIHYRYSSTSPTSDTLIPSNKGDGYLGTIASGDFSGYSGGHWIHHKPNITILHDHDTPSGETITYTLYVRSANTGSSYDWRFNNYTNDDGEDGVGRIILTELDL